MTIKVGDVVRLRSGGPEMTVDGGPYPPSKFHKSAMVDAGWFDRKNEFRRGGFTVDTLEVVRAAPLSPGKLAGLEGMRMSEPWRIKVGYYSKVAQFRQRLVMHMPWA